VAQEDRDVLGRLGDVLADADYTESGVTQALGGLSPSIARTLGRRGVGALGPLVDLFTLGARVDDEAARAALAPVLPGSLVDAGLLVAEDGAFRAPLRVSPRTGLLLAHDPGGRTLQRDWVGGPSEAASLLAAVTVRTPVERVLDLGTGSGIQALLAARHADLVVAVDVNPHAIELTRLNAELNRATNVECREGDLFGPVAGETFDLIVTNPPYVVSPDADYLFRDSGLAPGELCGRIAAEAPAFLRPGGLACILCNWATRAGEERWNPVRRWVEGNGCDALALSFGFQSALRYAAAWTRPPAARDAGQQAAAVERWLDFYEREGIESLWRGALLLRRSVGGAVWFAGFDAHGSPSESGGDQLFRMFEAQDFLADEPGDLLDQVFAPAPRHRLTHVLRHDDGEYALERATLELEDGVGVRADVEPLAVHVLLRLDGTHSVGEVVTEVSAERGLEAGALAEAARPAVRRLYERGFLDRVASMPP
jgi:SAM-dependent methyltransferase